MPRDRHNKPSLLHPSLLHTTTTLMKTLRPHPEQQMKTNLLRRSAALATTAPHFLRPHGNAIPPLHPSQTLHPELNRLKSLRQWINQSPLRRRGSVELSSSPNPNSTGTTHGQLRNDRLGTLVNNLCTEFATSASWEAFANRFRGPSYLSDKTSCQSTRDSGRTRATRANAPVSG